MLVLFQDLKPWAGSLWKLVKVSQSLVKMTRLTLEGMEEETGVWKECDGRHQDFLEVSAS